jgi:hypothetical protein
MTAIDPSQILAESHAGAAEAIAALVETVGGWVCEEHPDLPWPHDECPGPGVLKDRGRLPAADPRYRGARQAPSARPVAARGSALERADRAGSGLPCQGFWLCRSEAASERSRSVGTNGLWTRSRAT